MTTVLISGETREAPATGAHNAHITTDLETFAPVVPPYLSEDVAALLDGTRFARVAAARSQALPGVLIGSYFDDYYFRIHLTPRVMALGNLLQTELRTIDVWNGWPAHPVALGSVTTTGGDGITVTAPGALPMTFAPLQERLWDVTVDLTGPPVIDASIRYDFGGDGALDTVITGNRLIVWCLPPDWANGVLERLAWLTEILQARSGEPQKRGLRLAPRRTFEFDVLAEGQQRRLLDAMLADWSGRVWGLPIWPDGQLLGTSVAGGATTIPVNTTDLDFSDGGLALLWNSVSDWEVIEVDTVAADHLVAMRGLLKNWARGARIWPMRTARLGSDAEQQLWNDAAGTVHPSFTLVEPSDWPASWLGPTYRGLPVFELRPDEGTDPSATYPRSIEPLDNDTGIPVVIDWAGVAYRSPAHHWILAGRAARAAFRSLLYAFKGQLKNAWMPSWLSDLQLVEPVASASAVLIIEWAGYTRFGKQQINRRDIRIELLNGTVLYRRIIASIEIDAATEQLVLDATIGLDITPATVRVISFMALSELGSDAIEIQHETDADGIAVSALSMKAIKRDV